jgi:hypothetical protein
LTRIAGWEHALANYVEAARHVPFAWGRHDCLLFATGAMKLLTGIDPVDWLPEYSNPGEAYVLLRRYAGGDVDAAITKYLGPPLASPLMARRGDIACVLPLTRNDFGEDATPVIRQKTLGVVTGPHVAVAGVNALTFIPVTQAIAAWRV